MSISKKDVEHVAKLARLELTEEEKALYTEELNAVLGFMDTLNQLDTSDVLPTSHVLDIKNVFREDVMEPSMEPEEVVANAPAAKDNQFRVPKIM
jgi:aspartyl-tRNA(Asn)/glutamyl-tRNA(Gln) amidotransferase subunit C